MPRARNPGGSSTFPTATSRSSGRKFGNEPELVDGHRFDSQAEANRYRDLKLLAQAGEIEALELQPRFALVVGERPVLIKSKGFPNGRRASYRADFRYLDKRTGRVVVEDVKGHDTSESRLRRALVEAIYGVEVVVIGAKSSRNGAKNRRWRPKRSRK